MKKIHILLVCAGGASTGLLMRKMEKYAEANDIELKIKACGVGSYDKYYQDYDVLLVGPQVRYKLKSIQENINIPSGVMDSFDYGTQNCEHIMKMAMELASK